MPVIFLLEDDPMVREAVKLHLETEGFSVIPHASIAEARATAESAFTDDAHNDGDSREFDLFLLDVNLPDGNGFEFCRWLRERILNVPVIFLTARSDEDSLVTGFDAGADDFIRKPFHNKELVARIRYQLSQSQDKEKILRFNDVTLSLTRQELKTQNQTLSLNRREFQLLRAFFEAPGAVLTRDSLMDKIAPSGEIMDRTIDTHISHLRSKLKRTKFDQIAINSVYGTGYKLEARNVR